LPGSSCNCKSCPAMAGCDNARTASHTQDIYTLLRIMFHVPLVGTAAVFMHDGCRIQTFKIILQE
jgi:hypothetical protein